MVDTATTLSQVLDDQTAGKKSRDAGKRIALAVKDRIEVSHVPWGVLEEKLAQIAIRMLDIKLLDAWLGAWSKYRELHALRDPQKYPPEQEHEVFLAEHRVISEYHPSISIEMAKTPVAKLIAFEVRVETKLEGLCLKVRDGRIKELTAGRAQAEATLKLEDLTLWKVVSKPLEIGKPLDLGVGWEIP